MKTMFIAAMVIALLLAGPVWAGEHPEHPGAKGNPAEAASTGKGALDGKVFVGVLGKAGESEGDKDQLTFKTGTFVSAACVERGFNGAPYTVVEKDGVVTFASAPMNAGGETMSWTGTIRDGALEGTAVHKTASGETTYWFKGKLGAADSSSKHKEHPKGSEHPEHPR